MTDDSPEYQCPNCGAPLTEDQKHMFSDSSGEPPGCFECLGYHELTRQLAGDELTYPTPEEILVIHEDIVASNPDTEPGVQNEEAIESALHYISEGYFGEFPESVYEKAAHLMRLLASEHPFVDGNKRTALNTVAVFFELNSYEFRYEDEPIRQILKRFAVNAEAVDMADVVEYFREHTTHVEE